MVDTLPEGVTIRYQGKLCGPVFEFSRPVGLEPGFGSVFVSVAEFQDYKIDEGLFGVDLAPTGVGADPPVPEKRPAPADPIPRTQERGTPPPPPPPPPALIFGEVVRGWQSAGPLEFIEVEPGNPEPHTVTIQKVCLTERAVESAFAFDDDESDLCRVEIADIRYLWGKRGVVTAWVNMPRNAVGFPVEGGDPARLAAQRAVGSDATAGIRKLLDELAIPNLAKAPQFGSAGEALAPHLQSTSIAAVPSVSAADILIPGSLNPSTHQAWTLREVLERLVLPNLPGAPRLNRLPPGFEDAKPIGHAWNVVLAKEALRDLLDEFDLVLSLDLDSNVSLWKKNEGPSQTGFERILVANPNGSGADASAINVNPHGSAGSDPRVASMRRLVAYNWRPSVVLVVGAPRIVEERMVFEAVGEIAGQVVPLEDALRAIGTNLDTARASVLTRSTWRMAMPGLSVEGVSAFEKWAFKWFRIEGGADLNADKLPMLDGRGAKTASGQLHPPRVFSEQHTVVSIMQLLQGRLQAKRTAQLIAQAEEAIREMKRKDASVSVDSLMERVKLVLKFSGLGPAALKEISERTIAQINREQIDLPQSQFDAIAKSAAEQADAAMKSANPDGYHVLWNQGFQENGGGYEIDRQRGLVMFHDPQGAVFKDGAKLDSVEAFLDGIPLVEVEFAHVLKPSLDDPMRLTHRYNSIWVRFQNGSTKQIAQIPEGSAPLRIERPELQQIDALDGTTNKAALDAIAARFAGQIFDGPQSQTGFVATLCRPVRAVTTGQALSIRWHMDSERPRTEVHVSSTHPLSGAADLHTRAFGVPGLRARGVESVIAPRGITH